LVINGDQKTLATWACDCSLRVLHFYEDKYPHDLRPRKAIEACKLWIKGEMKMWDARKTAFAAHAVARETEDMSARSAARACGHAVATAHVKTHAVACACYAAKAIEFSGGDVKKERDWQYKHLLDLSQDR